MFLSFGVGLDGFDLVITVCDFEVAFGFLVLSCRCFVFMFSG